MPYREASPSSSSARHAEPGIACAGEVTVKVAGGIFDAWISYVAFGGLILSGVVFFFWAGRATWGRL